MSSRFDLLSQQLLEKNFADCTLDELEGFAQQYPYVAAAQFLVAKKLMVSNDPAYRTRAQKAALYHHQPFAFEAFLRADENELAAPAPITVEPAPAELPVVVTEPQPAPAEPEQVDELPVAHTAPAVDLAPAPSEPEAADLPAIPRPVLPKLSDPVVDTGFSFEPFHTVDYFASQGIKLSFDEVPKDKFGRQLKSFTEWLKTMKKLPAAEQARNMDPQAEQKVESMAAHSVSTSEIVTETMAEVWVKQGQWQKAADVYRKLSLLHPGKKAYFAAKLQNLKP